MKIPTLLWAGSRNQFLLPFVALELKKLLKTKRQVKSDHSFWTVLSFVLFPIWCDVTS